MSLSENLFFFFLEAYKSRGSLGYFQRYYLCDDFFFRKYYAVVCNRARLL